MIFKVFVVFFTLVSIAELTTVPVSDTDITSFRLPNDTIPVHYYVSLTTDVHDNGVPEFSGRVRITVKIIEETSVITIQYRQQTITRIDLFNHTEGPGEPELLEADISPLLIENFEFLQVRTSAALTVDQLYIVEITFNNTLRDDNSGFYRSFYNTTQGETIFLAATQFEATGARHAFPCYDEPGLRATFTIEIRHDMSYNAISNWPVYSIIPEIGTNKFITTFEKTYPMPTYLIGFIVSNFPFIQRGNQRVYASPESVINGEADFALNDGIRILEVCEELWGVPFTLPKVDQVAVPDFAAGGMEEWGLLTYREEVLLYNNETATLRNQETVLRLMSHEYAHLWFGNLVSPLWWSYLWVKEAFGQFYAIYLTSLIYTEDRWMDAFVVDSIQNALTLDAHPNIRPMTHHAETPSELAGLFDVVAYDKAASVIWMMQNALGDSTYIKGLRYYLETSAHQSVGSEELYAGIQASIDEDFPEASRLDFATIMRTWEFQSSYPLITVSRNGNQLVFTQERFFYTDDVSENLWWVPINYVVGSNPDFSSTLPQFWIEAVPSVNITSTEIEDWIVVNSQESSYYRVNYDNYLWNLLRIQLNNGEFEQIHVLNRAQLVDDSLNLAQAGRIDYGLAFEILSYLSRETDHIPWAAANRGMALLNRWLESTDVYANYQRFVRTIVEPLLVHSGFDIIAGEHRMARFARTTAVNLACEARLPLCLTQTAIRFEQAMNGIELAPDMQPAIFCQGLRQGNATHFNFLHTRLRNSNNQAERTVLQLAFACSQDSALLTGLLQTTFTSELRLTEKLRILTIPQNNGALGLRVMMNLIRSNHDDIINVAPGHVNTMLSSIASRVSSEEVLEEFDSLLIDLQDLNRITETARISFRVSANTNLNWQQRILAEIRDWLEANANGTSITKFTD